MSSNTVIVRAVEPRDEGTWRRLWAGYLDFYETSVPDSVTELSWSRLIGDEPSYLGTVAEVDGSVVGIANSILHASTWSDAPFCYLNDLFVDPEIRGKGVGKALIDDLIAKAKENGWDRVYWLTRHDNATARRLYDRYVEAGPFVRYAVILPR